ncbi:hypothetical protein SAMN02910298_01691 [Pseudobutyrivibrio sp. YE44]|uniref:hypothetical protein n=1 Tax=Pseudobutyrivibrio sp. YE44 TaxID=1520802 RepID=UPI00087E8403|nr:hypothetical protein [Pseudobutyrivibrio sp. YE44]SDB34673.1 hypothetical protein SAMN02910298_01691 [Pseudobutyrivibrio sp. YE44]
MKKRIMNLVLALALTAIGLTGQITVAQAEEIPTATFKGSDFNSNFDHFTTDQQTIPNIMPGDTVTFQAKYVNDSGAAANFYLNTDVISSLEEKSADNSSSTEAKGGGYTFKLTQGSKVLYDSNMLGGDDKGLHQFENEGDTYFSLGQLANGGSGIVNLEITLDGNSQDNSYMYKLATLEIRFAAEKLPGNKPPTVINNVETNRVVYRVPGGSQVVAIDDPSTPLAVSSVRNNPNNPNTGDSMIPLMICSAGLLIGIIFIAMYFVISKKQREEVA